MDTLIRKLRGGVLVLAMLLPAVSVSGCAALAGGVVGGVIGHEIAEEENEDD